MEDSWLSRLQEIMPTLKVGVSEGCKSGRIFLLGLLGPTEASPKDDDGWFASDFALAHLLYKDIVYEQCWLTCVDLLEEVGVCGPYLWGHPKEERMIVFSEQDSKFYCLCPAQSLIAEFKSKLEEMTSSMDVEDRLLLLIFAHGERAGSSAILVGADASDDFGLLTAEEVNNLLQPLSSPVTLITSACYSGVWHSGTPIGTRVAASSCDEESLSFPLSDSQNCRGGYFWGGIWYELSRLGIWVVDEEVQEDDTFGTWSKKIKQRVQDMFLFHPTPTVSVPEEDIWEKHAREVLCYDMGGNDVSSNWERVPPNPTADSIRDPDIHFTAGTSMPKVMRFPRLPRLMKYFTTCNPGLPNAANNIQVFQLAQLYDKGIASKDQLERLDSLLRYRYREDRRAQKILTFLRIPRVSSIFNFKQWENRGSEISPFLHVVSSVMPFGDPPKMKPRAYRYTKPIVYVAWSACLAKVDVEWLQINLCLYVESFRKSSAAGETSRATYQ